MKVLFFTSPIEDYLPDSLLHGFKSLYGPDVVDFPKCEILYKGCPEEIISQVRGRGFTLYSGLLDDLPVDRFRVIDRVKGDDFDLIVFSSIWRQYGWFFQLRPWLNPRKTIILDGEDTPAAYPAAGLWWRRSYTWLAPRAHRKFLYFKREWTGKTRFTLASRLLPRWLSERIPQARNLRPISFGFPEEKISGLPLAKTKDFPVHIVDAEVANVVPGSYTTYAFASEKEYYVDLQSARFGITTKRGGWDCLRHYEIAANGAVPCFRNLGDKPATCAPHGLNATNSISYRSVQELQEIIARLSPEAYEDLRRGSLRWIQENTTVAQVRRVLTFLKGFGAD